MIGHLFAAVPGQRLVQLVRQLLCVLDERINDRLRIFAIDLREDDVASLALDQRCNLAILAAERKVTFPVTRTARSSAAAGRSLMDTASVIRP